MPCDVFVASIYAEVRVIIARPGIGTERRERMTKRNIFLGIIFKIYSQQHTEKHNANDIIPRMKFPNGPWSETFSIF